MAENWIEREHKMPLIMIWMIINDEDVGDDDKDALPVTPRSVSSDRVRGVPRFAPTY